MEEGGRPLNSSRICLVGPGRAGKSALARVISNQEFQDTDSTIGVVQSFFEVDKIGLTIEGSGQWSVLNDASTVMSVEEALARCAAQLQLIAESTTTTTVRKKKSSSIIELLTQEEQPPDSHQSDPSGKTPQKSALPSKTQDSESNESAKPAQRHTLNANKEEVIKRMNMELSTLRTGAKEALRISLWDFGGQDKFFGIHHLYLSRYCVYLLVFNMKWLRPDSRFKEECLEYLSGWLNSITMHAVDPKDKSLAPILIIGTHKDEVPSPEAHDNISQLLDERFKHHRAWSHVERFKKGQGKDGRANLWFFPVDNTGKLSGGGMDPVIKEMQSTVLEVVGREKYVNHKVPYTWLKTHEALLEQPNKSLQLEEVMHICSKNGMGTNLDLNTETVLMLKFFDQMGLIMYHDEKALKHLVVLDPARFLVEPASRVICQHDIHENDALLKTRSERPQQYKLLRQGILEREILEILWSDVVDRHDLEMLMTKHQLIFPLTDDNGKDRFVVPTLLPEWKTNQVDHHRARLVSYFIFGHPDMINDCREKGYVLVDEAKGEGFLPKGLFAAVLGSIVSECQCVHDMSFNDMEMTTSSISTGLGRHQFELTQLLDFNMMKLIQHSCST
jgi:GTPase SAR1 family protein